MTAVVVTAALTILAGARSSDTVGQRSQRAAKTWPISMAPAKKPRALCLQRQKLRRGRGRDACCGEACWDERGGRFFAQDAEGGGADAQGDGRGEGDGEAEADFGVGEAAGPCRLAGRRGRRIGRSGRRP